MPAASQRARSRNARPRCEIAAFCSSRHSAAVLRSASALLRLLERVNLARPASAELPRLLAGTTWIGSSAKAQRALGFNPRQLEEGLRPTIEHELRALGMA